MGIKTPPSLLNLTTESKRLFCNPAQSNERTVEYFSPHMIAARFMGRKGTEKTESNSISLQFIAGLYRNPQSWQPCRRNEVIYTFIYEMR